MVDIAEKVREARLRLNGHTIRRDEGELACQRLYGMRRSEEVEW